MKLQKKILIIALILGFVFSFSIAAGVFLYLQNFLIKNRVDNVKMIVNELADKTKGNFKIYQQFIKLIASRTRIAEYLAEQSETRRAELDDIFNQYAREDENILSLYLMNTDGGAILSTDKAFLGKNYAFRDYFQKAVAGEEYVESAVGITSNQFGYYFSAPIKDDIGDILGVVVVKVKDTYINQPIFESDLINDNTFMLVDQFGVVMSSNRPERFLQSLGALSEKESAIVNEKNIYNGQKIKSLQYQAVKDGISAYASPFSVNFYDIQDDDHEEVYVKKIADLPYFLAVEIGLDKVRASIFYITFLIGFSIILIAFLVAIFGYRVLMVLIIRPIQKFAKTANLIGAGDFSTRLDVKTGDELEELSNTINAMSAQIKSYYEGLNEQVEKKTMELSLKNKEAEDQQKAVLNILEDIEEEKNKTDLLANDLEKFKLAVDNASDHIVITDQEGIVLYGNKAVEKITGYSLKEVIGKKAGVLWHKPMTKEFYERFWDTIKNKKKVFVGELINKRKSGELYSAEVSITPILDEKKNIKFFLGIERDISERKYAEDQIHKVLNDLEERSQKLAADNAKDEALFSNIGDGVVSTNQDGTITMINDSGLNMLGFDKNELIGHPVVEVFKMVDSKDEPVILSERPMVLALSTGIKTQTPLGKTYYYVRKDGTKFPVSITSTPFILNGKIVGVVEVFRDVTLEKDIDRMKTEFVSLASHQLRTPLSTINWYAEMLLGGDAGKLKAEQKEYIDEIYKGNQRMVELVNALLNVSRIELGTFAVDPEPTNIEELAETVFDELKPQIAEKKMKIIKEYDKTMPKISLDHKLFRIVIQNLMTNAVKYTSVGGKITLTIKKRKMDALISVADTGYGIPQKDQNKIFSKMFRADNVKVKDTSGTGLGLYIVRSIVEQTANGKIWFESKENKGSTFFVSVPLSGMIKKEGSKALS